MVKVGMDNHKLKASTLMEALVAMTILIITLGVATMIYSGILTSDKQKKKMHAILLANEEALLVKETNNYLDNEEQKENCIIKRTVEKYKDGDNLLLLSISVLDENGKNIFTRRELIIEQ